MTQPLRHVVVVGGGVAGLTACDTLRDEGFDGEITLVGSEPYAAYSRPALSKALLKMDAEMTAHELPPAGHGARELRGVTAVGLSPQERTVQLSTGERLDYDGLVIASGSRARRLSARDDERTLRDLDDARALQRELAARPDVVIVGGGVLGMEIASGAVRAGCRTTLLATSAPMSRQLGETVGELLTASALAQGLTVVRTTEVHLSEQDDRTVARTADGTVYRGDVLVSAVGDVPETDWLAESGLLREGRLITDECGRVAPDIVAAGDVVHWAGRPRTALWTSAIEQAKVAARTLLRPDSAALSFQNYFWTEQFGHSVKAVGPLPVTGAPEVLAGEAGSTPALLRWQNADGTRTVVAIDHRIPIPRLRRLTTPDAD